MILIFVFLGAVSAGAAESTAPAAPLLVNEEMAVKDQTVLECVERKSPERLSALMSLNLVEKKIQERFEELQSWIAGNSDATDTEITARLASLYSETELGLKKHLNANGKDRTLNAYRKAEASRVLAETALRLCIAGVADPEVVEAYRNKASRELEKGLSSLAALDPKRREGDIPSVLARMARTDLSLGQLERMLDKEQTFPGREFDRNLSKLNKYRKISGPGQEGSELDLLLLESTLSIDPQQLGEAGGAIYLDHGRQETIRALKAGVDAAIGKSKSPSFVSRARHVRAISEFYGGDRSSREAAVARLAGDLKSSDLEKRTSAEEVAENLMGHLGGTTLGRRMIEAASQSKSSEFLKVVEKNREEDRERGGEYDRGIEKALGQELTKKLGLANYEELMRSDGSLMRYQQGYVESLAGLGLLQARRTKEPKSVSNEEVEYSLNQIDMNWVYLQCARQQIGFAPPISGSVKAPFGSFDADLGRCAGRSGSPNRYQEGVEAHKVIQEGITRKTRKEVAWIAGEFVLDVATTLASGGASALVKAPIKAGLRKAGATLLRKEVLSPTVVKAGVRATGMATSALATDASVQSLKAGRVFLENGLKGRWDSELFTENFSYTKKDEKTAKHSTRILATAAANKGLDVLWGRARILAPGFATRMNGTRIGSFLGESTKGGVNLQLGGFVGEVATIPFGECRDLSSLDVFKGEKWVTSMRDSILGKAKGSKASSSRYVGASLLERLGDFQIDPLSPEQMEQLKQCTLPVEGSASLKPPGNGP